MGQIEELRAFVQIVEQESIGKAAEQAGRLGQVLDTYKHKPQGIYFVYPTTRYLPQRTRTLMDFLPP